ncbi:MAG: PAS domain S-box-containing protein [Gammaproteobacteria bacterium]|jgi:PAS domain S-box-containing protein
MTIQQKTFFIILFGLASTIGVIYTISKGIVSSSFQQLESKYVRANTQRAFQILVNELDHMSTFAQSQSELEMFFLNLDQSDDKRIQEILADSSPAFQRFNLIAFFDHNGTLSYGHFKKEYQTDLYSLPASWQTNMSPEHPLFIPRDNKGRSNGLMKMPDDSAIFINSKIIRKNTLNKTPNGTLILGQTIELKIIQRLVQVSKTSMNLLTFDEALSEKSNSDFYKSLSINAPFQVRIIDEQTINGFLLLKDIRNQPAFVLKISFPRDIYLQGEITLDYYTNLLVLIGIATILFVLLLMNQLVLSRLNRLSRGIKKVQASGDLKNHIEINGDDEFNYLARIFNELLDSLQLSREELEIQIDERITVEKEIRKSHSLYNQAELIGKLGHWEWDLTNDRLISCSEQFAHIYDLTIDEAVIRFFSENKLLESVHEDDRAHVKARLKEAFDNKQSLNLEYRIISSSGELRHVHQMGRVLLDRNNTTEISVGTLQDITKQKEAQDKLESYQNKLRLLMSEIVLVEEKERRRISIELHDNTIQNLGLSKFRLSVFKNTLGKDTPTIILDQVIKTIDKAIKDIRNLIFELSPPILYELGFVPAIEWLAEKFYLERGLVCTVKDDGENKLLDVTTSVMLFQIIRELLLNIVKHAKADHAIITIYCVEKRIKIEVSDDGIGFDISSMEKSIVVPQGYGLFSIRERLSTLGEKLVIESNRGSGTKISFAAPLTPTD